MDNLWKGIRVKFEGIEYPKAIIEELESLEKKKQQIISCVKDVKLAEQLVERFKDLEGSFNWDISVSFEANCVKGIKVRVDLLNLRAIMLVRKWLRKQGFPIPIIEEYPEMGRKMYTYHRADDEDEKNFEPFILMTFISYKEGAVCKYVKVGTKEEDVYELQCEGKKFENEEE